MAKYEMVLAVNVTAYGNVEVEADTLEDAIAIVHGDAKGGGADYWSDVTSVEWDTEHGHRIVEVSRNGEPLIDGVDLTDGDHPYEVRSLVDVLRDVRRWFSVCAGNVSTPPKT